MKIKNFILFLGCLVLISSTIGFIFADVNIENDISVSSGSSINVNSDLVNSNMKLYRESWEGDLGKEIKVLNLVDSSFTKRDGNDLKYGWNDTLNLKANWELPYYQLYIDFSEINSDYILREETAVSKRLGNNFSYPELMFYAENKKDVWAEHRVFYDFQDFCSEPWSDCDYDFNNQTGVFYLRFRGFRNNLYSKNSITNVSSCRTLTFTGDYQLNKSLTGFSNDCIIINGNKVYFYGNGFNITSEVTRSAIRIDDSNHIIISNFSIIDVGFGGGGYAIEMLGGSTDYVRNVSINNLMLNGSNIGIIGFWVREGYINNVVISNHNLLGMFYSPLRSWYFMNNVTI